MNSMNLKMVLMGLAITATAAACGPDDKGDGESINAVTARQALTGNTEGVAAKVAGALKFLESSDLANRGFQLGLGSSSTACLSEPSEGSGADFDSGDCSAEPVEPADLQVDLSEPAAELTQYLEDKIFADANIETSSDTQVTFLLKGAVVCGLDYDGAPDQACIEQVDNSQIRLKVTSPAEGDVDVAVLIGAQKHNPLSLEIHQSLIAAELDLAGIKGAITTLSGGEVDPSMPTTLKGRIRGEIEALGTDKARAAISVLSAIEVSGGDYNVTLAASSPALEVIADGTAKTLTSSANLGALHATGPMTTETYDDATGDFSEVTQVLDIAIAGLTAQFDFAGATDALSLTGLGLGDSTSTIKLDGAQILGIDLNADAGRKFSAALVSEGDSVTIAVDPKFDLSLAMDFSTIADNQGMPAWAMGDVLRILLNGATPTLKFGENSTFEVVSGNLEMSLKNAGDSIAVAAGQCLSIESDEPVAIENGGAEPTPEPTNEGPFSSMIAGECAI